jgi:hypothetical protein
MWAAAVAAAAAIFAAGVTAYSTVQLKAREEAFTDRQRAVDFLGERLTKLYVPVSMHLAATDVLFKRFNEPNTSRAERTAIEHEMHDHNSAVLKTLMESSVYTEPADTAGACNVDTMITDLIDHLIQWETVYSLQVRASCLYGPCFRWHPRVWISWLS